MRTRICGNRVDRWLVKLFGVISGFFGCSNLLLGENLRLCDELITLTQKRTRKL
jgi:hypothetical protein